ncbi:MAG TPA: hypothetical protein VNQ54_13230 [Methylomirabilota bacterium]|nr:hypothetical protein [Methylomirabilota bacterium]
MARLPDPLDTLSPEAKQVYDKITAKRGAVRGPFASLMHHPALAERVGDLGEYLRFGGTLPGDIRELARGDLAALPARYARPARVVQHVLAYESIPADLQAAVQGELGITGLMELVTLAGQYRMIAGVLFAFDTPIPEGERAPF